jgi:hypothetical protein
LQEITLEKDDRPKSKIYKSFKTPDKDTSFNFSKKRVQSESASPLKMKDYKKRAVKVRPGSMAYSVGI